MSSVFALSRHILPRCPTFPSTSSKPELVSQVALEAIRSPQRLYSKDLKILPRNVFGLRGPQTLIRKAFLNRIHSQKEQNASKTPTEKPQGEDSNISRLTLRQLHDYIAYKRSKSPTNSAKRSEPPK